MSTTVTYKGDTLATVSNNTKTLKTAGKYMEGDVVLTDVSASANVWQDENGYVHLDDEGTSSVSVEALSVTQNGTYTAPTGKAYSPVTVNVSGGGGGNSSAGLVQKWTYDKQIVRDEGVTLPAWSTSLQTLKESVDLSPSITLDISNYYYFVNLRTLAYPIYSGSSLYKGKTDYSIYANIGQMLNIPADAIKDRTGAATAAAINTYRSTGEVRCAYWNSETRLMITSTAYGGSLSPVTPSSSATSLTVKSPTLEMRGHASYYNETAYNETTDIRYQYIIEVYRIAKQNAPENLGGMLVKQFERIFDSVNNNNMTLT